MILDIFFWTGYFLTYSGTFLSQFLERYFLTYVFNEHMNVVSGLKARMLRDLGKKPFVG